MEDLKAFVLIAGLILPGDYKPEYGNGCGLPTWAWVWAENLSDENKGRVCRLAVRLGVHVAPLEVVDLQRFHGTYGVFMRRRQGVPYPDDLLWGRR